MDGRLLGWVPVPPRRARFASIASCAPLDSTSPFSLSHRRCSGRLAGRWPTPSPLGLSLLPTASDGASEFDGSAFGTFVLLFSTLFLWGLLAPVSAVCRRPEVLFSVPAFARPGRPTPVLRALPAATVPKFSTFEANAMQVYLNKRRRKMWREGSNGRLEPLVCQNHQPPSC